MNGCGTGKTADIQNPYSLTGDNSSVSSQFFARNLCVTDDINFGTDQVHADYAEGAGVFDLTTKEVLYSQNLFEKLYPASTTKILTAYIIIRNCDLDDKVTVSADAIANMADSSKCGHLLPEMYLLSGIYCTDCYLSVEMMRQMSLPNIIPGQLTNLQKK